MILTGTSMLPSANELRYSTASIKKLRISSSARAVRKKPERAGDKRAARAAEAPPEERAAEKEYRAVASSEKLCTRW
jgi:hypothetical protein